MQKTLFLCVLDKKVIMEEEKIQKRFYMERWLFDYFEYGIIVPLIV